MDDHEPDTCPTCLAFKEAAEAIARCQRDHPNDCTCAMDEASMAVTLNEAMPWA